MAHLKCQAHHNRVLFTTEEVLHRNGNGGPCDSQVFLMGRHKSSADAQSGEPYKLTRNQVYEWARKKSDNPGKNIREVVNG